MKKRLISILLIAGIIAAAMTGCSKGEDSSTALSDSSSKSEESSKVEEQAVTNKYGWEVPKETLVIDVFNAAGNYAPTEAEKIGLENSKKLLKEEFNIDYKFEQSAGDGVEALNLALASNQYPSVIYEIKNDMTKKFVAQGKAQELTPYMDTIATDIRSEMGDMYPLYLDVDQKLWYFPIGMGALYELPDYSAHIRYDEYNAIGAPKIETPDDYYNALSEILKEFPKTPEGETRYLMSLYDQGDPAQFSGYWGLKNGYKIGDDNSFTYWAFTEEGKEMSKFFNRFYKDGTLDPDAFINKFEEWKAKFSRERVVGAIGGWWIGYNAGHETWLALDPELPEDKRFIQVSFKDPKAESANLTAKSEYGWANTIITDKAKDVESIVKFINFEATERGRALAGWGIPNGTSVGDTEETIKLWNIDDSGKWEFDPDAKKQFIDETFAYEKEGYIKGIPSLFSKVSRWEDGEHCIWGNQMWYNENKWKSIMMENMDGTIFNATPMTMRDKADNIILIEQAIKDAWKMNWPTVVQSKDNAAFDKAWEELQKALTVAGVKEYEKAMSENYVKNLEKLK